MNSYLHDEAVRCGGVNGLPFCSHGSVEEMVKATGERLIGILLQRNVYITSLPHTMNPKLMSDLLLYTCNALGFYLLGERGGGGPKWSPTQNPIPILNETIGTYLSSGEPRL